jgi:hypothetical protein
VIAMTLTREQALALEALLDRRPPNAAWLAWLGLSERDLQTGWRALRAQAAGLESAVVAWSERNPLEALFQFIAAAALAFYAAEKGANAKIQTYVDAFYYIGTCASVGYADIFAVTQTGRAVAALVMMVGPALAARALDRPARR